MLWSEIAQDETEKLLESGLARIHKHLAGGGSLGIISGTLLSRDQKGNEDAHRELIKRLREHGYGPIESTGRSKWGIERSLVVPNAREDDLKKIGNEFGQDAVIHVPAGGKKNAVMHHLKASPQAGTSEDIGPEHFNTPNVKGITILKGLGYNPRDANNPTRSFTFGNKNKDNVIEALIVPRGGQLHPFAKPYVEEQVT